MESSANQLTPHVDVLKLSTEDDFSPLLIEIEESFCRLLRKKLVGEKCHTCYAIEPGLMRFFIHFDDSFQMSFSDVLKKLNLEFDKHMLDEGWDYFFIRENKMELSPDGIQRREWECISHNLNFLGILKGIR